MAKGEGEGSPRATGEGSLAGGLAHEIKNPLSTVSLNLQLVREDVSALARRLGPGGGGDERVAGIGRRVDTLLRETARLRDILDDFLRFAGRMELDRSAVDVNRVVRELVDFFEPQAEEAGVTLEARLPGGEVLAWADEGLVKQALLNLMLNATQAMSGAREREMKHGGARRLVVRVRRAGQTRERGNSDAWLADSFGVGMEERSPRGKRGGEVFIGVLDDGPGVEAGVRERMFEPYFSRRKGGTGLGLAMAKRIAEEHGGWLGVESEVGVGSEFVLALPGVQGGGR